MGWPDSRAVLDTSDVRRPKSALSALAVRQVQQPAPARPDRFTQNDPAGPVPGWAAIIADQPILLQYYSSAVAVVQYYSTTTQPIYGINVIHYNEPGSAQAHNGARNVGTPSESNWGAGGAWFGGRKFWK